MSQKDEILNLRDENEKLRRQLGDNATVKETTVRQRKKNCKQQ